MRTPMPAELAWATRIVSLCERFHVLPSQVLAEDAGLLQMLALLDPECGKAED